jgi:hypothetical protein
MHCGKHCTFLHRNRIINFIGQQHKRTLDRDDRLGTRFEDFFSDAD